MSKSLILVKYSFSNGEMCESNSTNIDSVDISDTIANQLELTKYIQSISILEEENGDTYEAEAIDNTSLQDFRTKCEERILSYCAELKDDAINDKKRNAQLDSLTTLLLIRRIIMKKTIKFANDESVIIVLG